MIPLLLLAGVTVALPIEARVAGSTLSVGDVASVTGDDPAEVARVAGVSLGRAPLPGYSRLIQRERVRAVLARELAGVDVRLAGEPACRVWPEVAEVEPAAIRAAAERELARAYAGRDVAFELRTALQPLEVPAGSVALRAEPPAGEPTTGAIPVPVRVVVDGEPFRTVWTSWDVERWETLPVLARAVEAGERIEASMLVRRRVLTGASDRPALPFASVGGAVAARALAEGEAVRKGDVHRAVVVVPGAELFLEVQRGPITARVPAVSRDSAAVGDRVRVETADGRELTATLLSSDVARIVIGRGAAGGRP